MSADNARKIYSKDKYIILQVSNGYIVYNTNKKFEEGHTHLESYNMAKTIINNCIHKKRPKTDNLYLITSHIRVSDDVKYIQVLNEMLAAKKNKGKKIYRNRSNK